MVKTTAFMPMVLADMTLGVVSDRFTIAIPVKVLTKATAERTSSRPRPIPRILPANRKATVMANKTHSTAMAMSESRALPVMGKGSVFVSMIAGDKAAGDAKTMEGMIASKQQGSRNFWRDTTITFERDCPPHVCRAALRLFYCCDSGTRLRYRAVNLHPSRGPDS